MIFFQSGCLECFESVLKGAGHVHDDRLFPLGEKEVGVKVGGNNPFVLMRDRELLAGGLLHPSNNFVLATGVGHTVAHPGHVVMFPLCNRPPDNVCRWRLSMDWLHSQEPIHGGFTGSIHRVQSYPVNEAPVAKRGELACSHDVGAAWVCADAFHRFLLIGHFPKGSDRVLASFGSTVFSPPSCISWT